MGDWYFAEFYEGLKRTALAVEKYLHWIPDEIIRFNSNGVQSNLGAFVRVEARPIDQQPEPIDLQDLGFIGTDEGQYIDPAPEYSSTPSWLRVSDEPQEGTNMADDQYESSSLFLGTSESH